MLVKGRLHVVETYTSAAIDWAPAVTGGWEGQYLFASQLGSPQGRVSAVFLAPPCAGLTSSAELYRAVYAHPATGIPFSFLPGVPVGVSG